MVLGGADIALAFGIGTIIAKVVKDSIKNSYAKKREENDRLAAELKAAEPERLAREKAAEEQAQQEYQERVKKAEAEDLAGAEEVRKNAIPFSDFEKGNNCPKCGKGWHYLKDAQTPTACNCKKCSGTHFHLTCNGSVYNASGYYKTVGCQGSYVMLAKDNKNEV